MRVLSVGSVLRRTLVAWIADAPRFAAIFLLVNVPILLALAWHLGSPERWADYERSEGWYLGLGQEFLETLAVGATVHGTFQRLQGRRVVLGKCLSSGASRFLSLFGVAFRTWLFMFGVGVVLLVGLAIVAVAIGLFESWPALGRVIDVLVYGVIGIPILLVALRYATAGAVCIVEGTPAGHSMRRARELQRGSFGPLLGIFGILWGARIALYYAVGHALSGESALVAVAGPSDRLREAFEAARLVTAIEQGLAILVFGPLFAVAATVVYRDLRFGKEGVDTEELAGVFD